MQKSFGETVKPQGTKGSLIKPNNQSSEKNFYHHKILLILQLLKMPEIDIPQDLIQNQKVLTAGVNTERLSF